MAGATGIPRPRTINGLHWQRSLNPTPDRKRQFGPLATPIGTGPPEIATAAPDGNRGGGKANQSSSNNPYREPPLASNWKPIGDVAAMLVRRLGGARREPEFAHEAKGKPGLGPG
jgi:hypothetical protein